jgi:hypothetical protein
VLNSLFGIILTQLFADSSIYTKGTKQLCRFKNIFGKRLFYGTKNLEKYEN